MPGVFQLLPATADDTNEQQQTLLGSTLPTTEHRRNGAKTPKTDSLPKKNPITCASPLHEPLPDSPFPKCKASKTPQQPLHLHWNKSPSPAFTDRQRRARRRSSLCYSETAHSADNAEETINETTNAKSRYNRSGSPKRFKNVQSSKLARRPDFQVCSACKDHILNSSPLAPSVSPPQQPSVTRRRSSYEGSHKEALVGSYEESLLSGRMSAPSSAPVSFHMKLGALGSGDKCPAKLKFPKHFSTCFDAVFYDHDLHATGTPGRGSPYVGVIDLEECYTAKPTKKFPGYRIPRTGQIQIIISNLQKTAVKLFLVPYDMSDLKPEQRTFMRQKVYLQDPKSSSKTLIQAVHFQVVCPSKGRYYLYGDLRLVFQNRASNADASSLVPSSTPSGSSTYLGISRNRDRLKVETVSGGFSTFKVTPSALPLPAAAAPTKKDETSEDDEEHHVIAGGTHIITPIASSALGKEMCVRCQSPISATFFGDSVVVGADDDPAPTTIPALTKPLAEDGGEARVILTREELTAQMLTDLKASSLDAARP